MSDQTAYSSTRSVSLRCTTCRGAVGNLSFVCLNPAIDTPWPAFLPSRFPTVHILSTNILFWFHRFIFVCLGTYLFIFSPDLLVDFSSLQGMDPLLWSSIHVELTSDSPPTALSALVATHSISSNLIPVEMHSHDMAWHKHRLTYSVA